MRRRFEKRVYIALPEGNARANMFKLNLGDTPNSVSDLEFQILGNMAEGYSGSDVAVVVREALMEPLRKCQQAKQFLRDVVSGGYHPCEEYPNCPNCPMALSVEMQHTKHFSSEKMCHYCRAERMSLYDVPSDKLVVPIVVFKDFEKALKRAHSSVGPEELHKFVKWTDEFGQEG